MALSCVSVNVHLARYMQIYIVTRSWDFAEIKRHKKQKSTCVCFFLFFYISEGEILKVKFQSEQK